MLGACRAPSRQLRRAASDEPLDLRVANATGSAALDTIGNRIRGYRYHCSIIGRIGAARKVVVARMLVCGEDG
jgi:hypothetical protein